ncbi:MAG: hypothetical protein QOK29_559 [Rhodospirillaceae bacterium]|jgi:hypothetical protein|nr:hypothetical protein [Rhodospirillaceae bacterium]
MSKVDEDAPLEENYEALSAALDEALTKASLAAEQLRVAKLTLEASESSLAEIETSEEARTECDVNFTVAHLVATRAVANLWEAADSMSHALGLEDEDEEEDE